MIISVRILNPNINNLCQDNYQGLTVLEEKIALKDYYLTKKFSPLIVSYNNKRKTITSNNQVLKELNLLLRSSGLARNIQEGYTNQEINF